MTDLEDLRTKQETLYSQIRRLTDRQLRLVVYLTVDGYSLSKALDLVFTHFITAKKEKSP